MKTHMWAKLKSSFSKQGRSPKENGMMSNLSNKLSVNEEYKEAFRTNSYVELWSKVGSVDKKDKLSSSSSLPPFVVNLSDYLFQPQPLRDMIEDLKFHHLLVDYLESSLDACKICDLLLQCIRQTRANYKRIKRAIKLSKAAGDSGNCTDSILRELAAFALLKNPLSLVSAVKFGDVRDTNMVLLRSLNSEQRKIRRRTRFKKICKMLGGCCLVISHTAIVVSVLAIAIHSVVGAVTAPGLLGCSLCIFRKEMKLFRGKHKTSLVAKRLCTQLDLAAKGTYILINDFDTISRLVGRLHDEIDHRKALADLCVRNRKTELMKEVVKEFYAHQSCYLEQLEELERHVYLCFHTINRSRRLVIEQSMASLNNKPPDHHQGKFL